MVSSTPGFNPERRLAALARTLKLLRETDDFDRLSQALLKSIQDEFHYTVLWLGLYDQTQHHIIGQDYIAPHPHRLLKSTYSPMPGDLMEQVVIQQRPLIINDLRVESRVGPWNELAEQLNLQGTLLFPIRRRDRCYGLLLLGGLQWGQTLSTSDRTFLFTVSGTFADVLAQREHTQQEERRKNPGTSMMGLIHQLHGLTDYDEQLAAIASALLQLIEPDRVRIFWLNPDRFEFWERLTLQSQKTSGYKRFSLDTSELKINAADIRGIYPVLSNQQLLVIGDSKGALMANVPERFVQLLNAQALMVAPVCHHQTLLGFISLEGTVPRVWSSAERDYFTAVARLTGLLLPGNSVAEVQQQSAADLHLLTGVVHSIQNDTDWHVTLEQCGDALCQRLAAQQLLVLAHDAECSGYTVVFQTSGPPRPGHSLRWDALDDVDWQMLERSPEAIAINNTATELKLLAWRDNFQALHVKSLLACNVSPGNPPAGVVLLTHASPRYWTPNEGQLVQRVAQQIGLILRQWQLQRQMDQQEDLYDSIQWGLTTLQRTFQLEQLEAAACRYITELLEVSLVVLVSWQVGQSTAQIAQVITRHQEFGVNETATIAIASDAVVNWALQTGGPLPVTWEDLPDDTRHWVMGPPASKFLLIALRTADTHTCNGVWLLGAPGDRPWSDHDVSLVTLLANQLAWSRRHLSIVEALMQQRETLATLNWYKHRQFSDVYRHLEANLQRLNDPLTQERGLTAQRQLQLKRQLERLTTGMRWTLESEEWQLQRRHQTTPLASLINRLMERVNPLIKARQLWAKVHNNNNVIIGGDLDKIEFVLLEIITAACIRSPEHGHLDIWCRPLDRSSLELSITDDGDVPQPLLTELRNGRPEDILVPSPLDTPPGLNLSICQSLMQQTGGTFNLQKLEDGRIISRVILAISGKTKSVSSRTV